MARASRGAWVRFNVVRTDARGGSDRSTASASRARRCYRFRALSLTEAAYPYLAGGSNVVTCASAEPRAASRAGDGTRTRDNRFTRAVLYQLSYSGRVPVRA